MRERTSLHSPITPVSAGLLALVVLSACFGRNYLDPDSLDAGSGNAGPPGPAYVQAIYLKASNSAKDLGFGSAVAIDGDTVVVGAYGEDTSEPDSGAVYVFVRDGEEWNEQAMLKASNPGTGDGFGFGLALRGDTLVVSSFNESSAATGINGEQDDNSQPGSGAVYVFVRDAEGAWTQQAYIKASNTDQKDGFGSSLCLGEDRLVVGAFEEWGNATSEMDNGTPRSGATYVFERTSEVWVQSAYLKASNPYMNNRFGAPCALAGDTLVIGSPSERSGSMDQNDLSTPNAGAAYVFKHDAGGWAQTAYLKAEPMPVQNGYFGRGLLASNEHIFVKHLGDMLVYGLNDGQWRPDQTLKLEEMSEDSITGLAMTGNRMLVGRGYSRQTQKYLEQVQIFQLSENGWSEPSVITANAANPGDGFGSRVAISAEGLVVVGASREGSSAQGINGNDQDNSTPSGAAYIFVPAD